MVGFTCLWCRLITNCLVHVGAWLMHLFMVHVDYKLRYRLMHGSGLLVHVYSSISHNDSVIVVHHSTSTSGWQGGARIGGCSHLPVVSGEHKGL